MSSSSLSYDLHYDHYHQLDCNAGRALSWWLVGFALAYGEDSHGFIGTNVFALSGGESRFGTTGLKEAEWVFDWAFAGVLLLVSVVVVVVVMLVLLPLP